MEYNLVLNNFCERKLYPNRPEYLNAFSALYISAISYYMIINCKKEDYNYYLYKNIRFYNITFQ